MSKETDRRLKKLDELFTGQWGKLIEALVKGDFIKLLKERNIPITELSQHTSGSFKGQKYEFDIIAKNGDCVVVCEVKTTLKVKHVKYFIEQMEQFRIGSRIIRENKYTGWWPI